MDINNFQLIFEFNKSQIDPLKPITRNVNITDMNNGLFAFGVILNNPNWLAAGTVSATYDFMSNGRRVVSQRKFLRQRNDYEEYTLFNFDSRVVGFQFRFKPYITYASVQIYLVS